MIKCYTFQNTIQFGVKGHFHCPRKCQVVTLIMEKIQHIPNGEAEKTRFVQATKGPTENDVMGLEEYRRPRMSRELGNGKTLERTLLLRGCIESQVHILHSIGNIPVVEVG